LVRLVAVHRARRDEDDALDADVAHGFHDADRPPDVDGVVLPRVEDRLGDRYPGGEVVDAVHFLELRPELGTVGDVAAGEEDVLAEAGGITTRKVVEGPHLMAFPRQTVREGRAKKAGCACDKEVHGW
jgi:hypothetical protein